MVAVALVVADVDHRPVDRDVGEVGAAEPDELGVQVGEVPGLEQRVVGEVDAGHHVGGAEGDLLGLGEEVVRVAVEHHAADGSYGDLLLRDDLRGVEEVEVECVLVLLGYELHAQLPLGVLVSLDGVPEVAAVEVGVAAHHFLGLVPDQRVDAQLRLPVELDEGALALGVDEPEGVHPEALHHAVAARDGPVGHQPHDGVQRLRLERDEVPEGVVGGGAGGDLVVRLHLHRVHEVRELDAVLDEEDREVVAHQVVVSLAGVELRREAAHVTHGVGGAAGPLHGGEADEDRGAHGRVLEEGGPGELRAGGVGLEVAVRPGAPGVHDPLGDALVVEAGDLLPEVEVLQQGGPAFPARSESSVCSTITPWSVVRGPPQGSGASASARCRCFGSGDLFSAMPCLSCGHVGA